MHYWDLPLSAHSLNFLSPAARRRTAVTKPTPTPLCSICGKPVELETSKTDSNAEAVHEECYARKIESRKPPNPFRLSHGEQRNNQDTTVSGRAKPRPANHQKRGHTS